MAREVGTRSEGRESLGESRGLAIQTFEFLGFPDVVSVETLRFVDLGDGRTRLEVHSVHPSLEARDGMVASGMERGLTEGYARLDAIVAA